MGRVDLESLRARLLCWLEVPAVHVERHGAEVFRKKCTRITIDKESEFRPLGEELRKPLKGYP